MHNLCAHLLPSSAQVGLHRLCTASTNQLWQQLVHQLPDTCSRNKSTHSSRHLKDCRDSVAVLSYRMPRHQYAVHTPLLNSTSYLWLT